MLTQVDWRCSREHDAPCYYEQNGSEALVVIRPISDVFFEWVRIYHSKIPIKDTERLVWASFSNNEIALMDPYVSVNSSHTTFDDQYDANIERRFNETKKNAIETFASQVSTLRRKLNRARHRRDMKKQRLPKHRRAFSIDPKLVL